MVSVVLVVVVIVVVVGFWGGGGGGGLCLDVVDGLLLMLLGSGRGGFSAGTGTRLDDWCADANGWWWWVFCIRVGGEGGKGTILYGAIAGWSAAEFAGCGAGG